ncbi:MAG: rubrerythrin family protein [Methanobacteriota archaeon]
MDLKGSQTEKNILAAFAGESQARNRYTFFASVAKKEGYEQIASIFLETAENEKEHAKLFFTLLPGGDAEITASYPAGKIGTTPENLKAAADGELHEWGALYPEAAQIADKEGFPQVAHIFKEIAKVEVSHERRYRRLLSQVEQSTVFSRDEQVRWKCRNCGYVHDDSKAPQICPVCSHPVSYFELWCENY